MIDESGPVVGKVVIIFDRLEGCWFAKETEVVDGDWVRKQDLEGFKHAETGAEDGN